MRELIKGNNQHSFKVPPKKHDTPLNSTRKSSNKYLTKHTKRISNKFESAVFRLSKSEEMDAPLHEKSACADTGNVLLGFGLATAAGMMTFVGAFTVFIKIRPK